MEQIYILLRHDNLTTHFTREKPEGHVIKQYTNKRLNTKFQFVYGRKFSKGDFFKSKSVPIPLEPTYRFDDTIPCFTDVSILKSTLQKCVRRQETELALMCAKTMMRVNFKSFLRRLIIIAAEDVFLDKTANTALWMFHMVQHGVFLPVDVM